MIKGLSAAIRREFSLQLRARLPHFQRAEKEILWTRDLKNGRDVKLGTMNFVNYCKISPDLYLFIDLQISSKSWENWFCVELSWNTNPAINTLHGNIEESLPSVWPPLMKANRSAELQTKCRTKRFRLGTMSGDRVDGWNLLPPTLPEADAKIEDALRNLIPAIKDAMEKLCSRGVEWFRLVIELRGYDPNDDRLKPN